MKTAKIQVRSIMLVCPECEAVQQASKGQRVLVDGDILPEKWEALSRAGITCSNPACGRTFKLPTYPFPKEQGNG